MEAKNETEIGSEMQQRFEVSSLKLTYMKRTSIFLKLYWRIIFAICWAILLLPFIVIYDYSEVRCAYIVLLVAGYWVTESLPIGITSLIPVVLFPLFGILSTQETCACYMNDTIMVFIGGLILAIAIEHCNLHLRIALFVMKTLGCSHAKLLGGLCTVTTFISMWISNAAAAAMMVPIVFAVLRELERQGLGKVFDIKQDPENPEAEPDITPTKLTKAYLFAAAYSATFGGTGALVGTPTNLAFKGIYEYNFPTADPITFGDWMVASIPQMATNSLILWLYLRIAFLGYLRPRSKDAEMARIGAEGEAIANQVISQNLKNLGPMTFHEISVAILFTGCIFLWVFRAPGFVRGWSEILTNVMLADSMPVVFVCLLMFFIPKEPVFIRFFSKDSSRRPTRSSEGLITWQIIQTKMPWRLVFLLGSGFAVSKGSSVSGLAMKVGLALVPLKELPPVLMMAVVLFLVNTLTEFTSNVGTANIILPVVAHMCVAMKIHPLYLMMPVTLMCSYAFRMPVATPPNAIITVAGHLQTRVLIAVGCFPAMYTLIVQVILFPTWGAFIYGIGEFPAWAEQLVRKS
ncbi:PREDICTED: protein I'm not dead yet-like isoform X1 [Wasmannia auropunctata]|uniref:protein I'm not dead yet-like isoform X1 n=1 Tax=Wasmannia auropunctata TaxID=64793 RepID=UPI0005EF717F|nr:PREDICTED: protein I'm not dead yet-like isoform X1 [Wasmannia auropunctata]XP_011686289.1 PREDICTED: protein I'm not dead yet-like isoform X1 [Wasmannia auropunctata]